jgi:hypothetical protein
MKLAPMKILAAGAALIVLANAVALVGVYLESQRRSRMRAWSLTQRELGPRPGVWQADARQQRDAYWG